MKRTLCCLGHLSHSKYRRFIARTIWLLIICFPITSSCARFITAQTNRGSISGRVLDISGAVIPGARISLHNADTGFENTAITNAAGLYTIWDLTAGSYQASASMIGFAARQVGIKIQVSQTVHLDFVLKPGEIKDHIVVDDDYTPTLLNSEKPLLTTTVPGRVLADLPLTISGGRSIESFGYALAPAVEGDTWTSHIAGTPAFTKDILIDGMSATSQIQGNAMESSPTMESIGEVTIHTSGVSAEFGHAAGGVFNFELAHGTNNFHGSAYYYGRNEALNANTWMNNWQLSQNPRDPEYKRARDRQSIIGASAGGPMNIPGIYNGKNRTFIFGAFEHYIQEQLQIGKMDRTVPIPEFLDGNFSSLLSKTDVVGNMAGSPVYAGQIFDPNTMRLVGNQWLANPFPGNIIPKERMSVVSSKVIRLFKTSYQPILPHLTNNSAGPQYESPWFHQTQLTLKGDHSFSRSLKLTSSLIWTERPRILLDQGGIWDPRAEEGTGGPLARARKQNVTSRALRLSLDWSIQPTMLGTISLVYNRYRNPSISAQSEGNWDKYLGLESSTGTGLFPEISFGPAVNGISTTGIGYGSSEYYVANNYIVSATMNWAHGRHRVKFGGEFWAQQMNSHAGSGTLSFGFSATQTGVPGYSWSNRVGFGFGSFFLGDAEQGSKTVPFDLYGRRQYVALYFQDNYQVTRSLNLDIGLRWEQPRPLYEKYGRWANFNPSLTNTALNIKGALEFPASPSNSFERKKDWKEFGPRIGMAYKMGARAVVRASYGLSYIPQGMNYWSGVPYGFAPGYRGTNNQTKSPTFPKFNWDSGYPDNYQAPARNPNSLVYGMVSIDDHSLFSGYTHQYGINLQYELVPTSTAIQVAWMGSQGRRLQNGALKRNQPDRGAYENPATNPWAWVWDSESAAEAGVPYPYDGFSNFAGVALQPFPQVASETGGPLYYVGVPKGSSCYESFQVSLTRRISRGVDAQISYNLSRAVGNSETGFGETWDSSAGIQDINNLEESARTVLSYDQTHVFKGYVALELPIGSRRKYLAKLPPALNSILSGWKITGIFRYNSGNPLGVYPDVWYPGWEGAVYADYDPSVSLKGQFNSKAFNPGLSNAPGNLYFNPAAFSNPKQHKMGNGKRLYSELRGFGFANEDIGLLRNFDFKEHATIQLRAEFLNLFNRHHFADPNTGMGNSATFGYVTAVTGSPRVVQFGLRINW